MTQRAFFFLGIANPFHIVCYFSNIFVKIFHSVESTRAALPKITRLVDFGQRIPQVTRTTRNQINADTPAIITIDAAFVVKNIFLTGLVSCLESYLLPRKTAVFRGDNPV